MKIEYKKENKKNFRQINFYQKDEEKKIDTKTEKFLNFKVEKDLDRKKFISIIRSSVRRAISHKVKNLAFDYSQIKSLKVDGLEEKEKAKLFLLNIKKAGYVFDRYKNKKNPKVENIVIFGDISASDKNEFLEAEKIAEAVNFARDLANTPAAEMMPADLLSETKKKLKGLKNVSIKVVEEAEAKKLGMGLYLAVGQGSENKSKLIVVKYSGAGKNQKPTVLVGKGICYDTGGLSLKPAKSMLGMEMDMTGGATVIATISAIAKLGLKKNVVAVVPAVENAISAKSYRPGDILTAMDKTTVEVGNTDAEGRLVLADAITYSLKKLKPETIIDVATLTGAALVAVGQRSSVVMSNSEKLQNSLVDLGEKTGDLVWPLPAWDEYYEDIKGKFADIMNIGKTSPFGGTVTAGMFLKHFAENKIKENKKTDVSWAHIDIAPRMESIESDNLEVGATGEPVSLLVEYIKNKK